MLGCPRIIVIGDFTQPPSSGPGLIYRDNRCTSPRKLKPRTTSAVESVALARRLSTFSPLGPQQLAGRASSRGQQYTNLEASTQIGYSPLSLSRALFLDQSMLCFSFGIQVLVRGHLVRGRQAVNMGCTHNNQERTSSGA